MKDRRPPPVGDHLREARLALGFTQAQMGAYCGVGPRAYMRWELDQSAPTHSRLVHLALSLRREHPALASKLADDLGVAIPPLPSAPTVDAAREAKQRAAENARRAVLALYRAAERADVTARRARVVATALLEALAKDGVPVDEALRALATPEPPPG